MASSAPLFARHAMPSEPSPIGVAVSAGSFAADISAVPLSAVGGLVPFISYEPLAVAWEATLAAVVIITNAACVAWQTCGQVGLATPVGRSDTPRTLCVCLYATRSFVVIGFATGFSCAWMGMVLSLVMSAVLADVVARGLVGGVEPHAQASALSCMDASRVSSRFHSSLGGADGEVGALARVGSVGLPRRLPHCTPRRRALLARDGYARICHCLIPDSTTPRGRATASSLPVAHHMA